MAQLDALVRGCVEVDRADARRRIGILQMAQSGSREEIEAWLGARDHDEDAAAPDPDEDLAQQLAALGLKETTDEPG
jgi:hypothetical protein